MHHNVWNQFTTVPEVAALSIDEISDWLACYFQSVRRTNPGPGGRRHAMTKKRKMKKAIYDFRDKLGLP